VSRHRQKLRMQSVINRQPRQHEPHRHHARGPSIGGRDAGHCAKPGGCEPRHCHCAWQFTDRRDPCAQHGEPVEPRGWHQREQWEDHDVEPRPLLRRGHQPGQRQRQRDPDHWHHPRTAREPEQQRHRQQRRDCQRKQLQRPAQVHPRPGHRHRPGRLMHQGRDRGRAGHEVARRKHNRDACGQRRHCQQPLRHGPGRGSAARHGGQRHSVKQKRRLDRRRRSYCRTGGQPCRHRPMLQVSPPVRQQAGQPAGSGEHIDVPARHRGKQHQRVDGPQQVRAHPRCAVMPQRPVKRHRDRGERQAVQELQPEHRPGHRRSGQQRCCLLGERRQRAVHRRRVQPAGRQ
jgi:hypothetical protein